MVDIRPSLHPRSQTISQTVSQTERLTVNIALWMGIVFTAAAIVRVGLWRQATPKPDPLNPTLISTLQTKGWSIQEKKPAASQGEELSWAGGVELINIRRYPGAVLNLVPVRARGPISFTLETLVRPVVTTNWSATKLLRFGEHERARLQPINQQQIETACISSGVALADPGRMMRTKLGEERITTLQQQLERISGLRQTRTWDCLLVVVRKPVDPQENSQLWNEIVGVMRSWDGQRS